MSFDFTRDNVAIDKVGVEALQDPSLPFPIQHYIYEGLRALRDHYGDVPVNVTAYGHLHNGKDGNFDTTTATVVVCRADTTKGND